MTRETPKRLIVDVENSLHLKIKEMALQRGQTIKDLVIGLIIKEIIRRDYKKDVDHNV